MIKIKNKTWDIKESNFVYLVEKNLDLAVLENLTVDIKIINKIKKIIKSEKNEKLQFFLGEKHFENLFILIYSKKQLYLKILLICWYEKMKNEKV